MSDVADDEADVRDAVVTLYIHAGIAAADVVCCADLGYHASGQDHNEAVAELTKVKPDGGDLGKTLRTLLGMKTRAGYSAQSVSGADSKRARRRAGEMVDAARLRASRG